MVSSFGFQVSDSCNVSVAGSAILKSNGYATVCPNDGKTWSGACKWLILGGNTVSGTMCLTVGGHGVWHRVFDRMTEVSELV